MNQFYLHSSPEGVIKLIEGDKMPVKPDHPCEQLPDRGCPICAGYKLDLWAAKKEDTVTVVDQHRAKTIIMGFIAERNPKWPAQVLEIKPDTIYGPFSLRYEIREACQHESCPVDAMCEHCKEPVKIAILHDTPEKPGLRKALRES